MVFLMGQFNFFENNLSHFTSGLACVKYRYSDHLPFGYVGKDEIRKFMQFEISTTIYLWLG